MKPTCHFAVVIGATPLVTVLRRVILGALLVSIALFFVLIAVSVWSFAGFETGAIDVHII